VPAVSIIVPNFNHAPFLVQRLDTVFGQRFTDYEVILLDDASTDGSVDILSTYAARYRAPLIVNDRNSGSPFAQWNRGVSLAKGRFVWIAESDDYASVEFLSEMVPLLESSPRTGIACCLSHGVSPDGVIQGPVFGSRRYYDPTRWMKSFESRGHEEVAHYLSACNTIPNASGVVIRRAAYEEVGGADSQMRVYGDWLMWVKILERYNLTYHARPLNYFRVPHAHSQRLSTVLRNPRIDEWKQVVRYVESHFSVPPPARARAREYLAQKCVEFMCAAVVRGRVRAACDAWREARAFEPALLFRVFSLLPRALRNLFERYFSTRKSFPSP
jgi:glycosyltransferase involved in cell wall biosynthesis